MKEKPLAGIIIVLGLGVCVVVCLIGGLRHMENYDEIFYTKVDNSKVRELSPDSDMKYEYTLISYNENDKKRELDFKTSRILREDAYLLLEVRSMGVHKWEEVMYTDLPQKVQEKINEE